MSKKLAYFCGSLVACGPSIQRTQLNAPLRPMSARSVDSVEIFASGPPTRAFRDIELLSTVGDPLVGTSAILDEQIQHLRKAAADRGCDGIVIHTSTHTDEYYGGASRLNAACFVYVTP